LSFVRFKNTISSLDDREYKKIGVPGDNKFIRNRKMSFVDIILFILNNKGKTWKGTYNKTNIFKAKAKYKSRDI